LPNRHYFYQILLDMFEDKDFDNKSALLFIDNNNFKSINDQFGHLAVDEVLKEMAKRLQTRLRHQDFIARLGGDEFAVILHSITHADHLISIAENLLESCKEPLHLNDQTIYFSFSVGIALSQFASSPEDFIMQADQAMYKAKTSEQHWFIYKPEN
ncbi:GGDEF domain-containing protein, partial [Acinetobacter baumannii]